MGSRTADNRSRRRKPTRSAARKVPPTVVTLVGGLVHISPVDTGDTATIAGLLLDAASDAAQVRTTTGPTGWLVPYEVAAAIGVVVTPMGDDQR